MVYFNENNLSDEFLRIQKRAYHLTEWGLEPNSVRAWEKSERIEKNIPQRAYFLYKNGRINDPKEAWEMAEKIEILGIDIFNDSDWIKEYTFPYSIWYPIPIHIPKKFYGNFLIRKMDIHGYECHNYSFDTVVLDEKKSFDLFYLPKFKNAALPEIQNAPLSNSPNEDFAKDYAISKFWILNAQNIKKMYMQINGGNSKLFVHENIHRLEKFWFEDFNFFFVRNGVRIVLEFYDYSQPTDSVEIGFHSCCYINYIKNYGVYNFTNKEKRKNLVHFTFRDTTFVCDSFGNLEISNCDNSTFQPLYLLTNELKYRRPLLPFPPFDYNPFFPHINSGCSLGIGEKITDSILVPDEIFQQKINHFIDKFIISHLHWFWQIHRHSFRFVLDELLSMPCRYKKFLSFPGGSYFLDFLNSKPM